MGPWRMRWRAPGGPDPAPTVSAVPGSTELFNSVLCNALCPQGARSGVSTKRACAYDFGSALHEALTNSLCLVAWLRRQPAFPNSCLAQPPDTPVPVSRKNKKRRAKPASEKSGEDCSTSIWKKGLTPRHQARKASAGIPRSYFFAPSHLCVSQSFENKKARTGEVRAGG
jgi:hypothetical protein